jgi:hypothetical protein
MMPFDDAIEQLTSCAKLCDDKHLLGVLKVLINLDNVGMVLHKRIIPVD